MDINIEKKDYQILGKDNGEYTDMSVIIAPHCSNKLISTFNKNHRKKTGIAGLGKVDEHLAKKIARTGKVSTRLADKLYKNIDGLYDMMFSIFANAKLLEDVDDKIIYSDKHEILKIDNTYKVLCKVLFEPKIIIQRGIVLKFNYTDITVDQYVNNRIEAFVRMHPALDERDESLPAEEGNVVTVSIEAVADSERLETACEESTRLKLIEGDIAPNSLYHTLIGSHINEEFDLEVCPDDFPSKFGKDLDGKSALNLHVNILNINNCHDYDIDDDLAITAGYDSLQHWRSSLSDIGSKSIDQMNLLNKGNIIVQYLIEAFKCPDLPDAWVEAKLKEMHINDTKESRIKLHNLFKQIIILKSVGKEFNIEPDDIDKNVYERDDHAYAGKVLEHLISISEFIDVDEKATADVKGNTGVTT